MWKRIICDSSVPPPRSSHSVTAIGQKVYVFSGEKEPRVPINNQLRCFDLIKQCWSEVSAKGQLPPPRVGHGAAAIGSKLYVFGGRSSIEMGEGLISDLHCFDTQTGEWSLSMGSGPAPCGRSYLSMTSDGEQLYIFGGCSKERLNDLYAFNPSDATWTQLPTNPDIKPRGGSGLAVVDHKLYVIAGFTGEEVQDMYCFDLATHVWEKLNPQPNIPPISVFGTTVLKARILIIGGEVKPSDKGHAGAGGFSSAVYCYHTRNPLQGWTEVSTSGDAFSPRGWLPATTSSKDEVVIFGGLSPENERLNDLWVFH